MERIIFIIFTVCLAAMPIFAQWQADQRLTNDPNESRCATTKAVAASGALVHLVWFDERDANDEIYYKSLVNNGVTWSPDERLTVDGATSFYNSISVSGSAVHVTWYDNRNGNWEVYYKRNPTGNVFIDEQGSGVSVPKPFSCATMFKDRIIIQFAKPSQDPMNVKLYDVSRSLVYEVICRPRVSNLVLQGKKIKGLNRGVYFLSVESDKGIRTGMKLIKL